MNQKRKEINIKNKYINILLMKIIKHPDGRYKNQDNIFINKIYSFDKRYKLIRPIIEKKIKIMKDMDLNTQYQFNNITGFYFPVNFSRRDISLYYNFFYNTNDFNIVYSNTTKEVGEWILTKTIIYEGEEEKVVSKGPKGKISKKVQRKR
jgi:hypothetical protein